MGATQTIFLNPTVKGALGTGYLPPLCCYMHTLGFLFRKATFTYVHFSISLFLFLLLSAFLLSPFPLPTPCVGRKMLGGRVEGGLIT
jgi:hypothetical protein